MGIFDSMKKIGGLSKKAVDKISTQVKYRRKVKELKVELLMRFKYEHLKKISVIKGISDVKLVGDPISGYKKVKITNKKDLVEKMVKISWSELIEFAKRYRVKYKDLEEELERFKREIEEKHGIVDEEEDDSEQHSHGSMEEEEIDIKNLLRDFEPEPIINEEDLEKQLYQFLVAKLGRDRVRRQVSFVRGKIDLVLDDDIGIEIKIAKTRDDMKKLLGQIVDSMEYFSKTYAIILDLGRDVDLKYYKNKIFSLGAEVLVFRGVIKRIRGRSRIEIKFK